MPLGYAPPPSDDQGGVAVAPPAPRPVPRYAPPPTEADETAQRGLAAMDLLSSGANRMLQRPAEVPRGTDEAPPGAAPPVQRTVGGVIKGYASVPQSAVGQAAAGTLRGLYSGAQALGATEAVAPNTGVNDALGIPNVSGSEFLTGLRNAVAERGAEMTQQAPGATKAAELAGGALPFFANLPLAVAGTAGNAYQDALDKGATPEQARAAAAIQGGTAAAFPLVHRAMAPLAAPIDAAVARALSPTVAAIAAPVAKSVVTNAVQGQVQNVGTAAAQSVYDKEGAKQTLLDMPADMATFAAMGLAGEAPGVSRGIAEARARAAYPADSVRAAAQAGSPDVAAAGQSQLPEHMWTRQAAPQEAPEAVQAKIQGAMDEGQAGADLAAQQARAQQLKASSDEVGAEVQRRQQEAQQRAHDEQIRSQMEADAADKQRAQAVLAQQQRAQQAQAARADVSDVQAQQERDRQAAENLVNDEDYRKLEEDERQAVQRRQENDELAAQHKEVMGRIEQFNQPEEGGEPQQTRPPTPLEKARAAFDEQQRRAETQKLSDQLDREEQSRAGSRDHDIIDSVQEHGGILPPDASAGGEYDAYRALPAAIKRSLTKFRTEKSGQDLNGQPIESRVRAGSKIDQIAKSLHAEGIGDGTPETLMTQVENAWRARAKAVQDAKAEAERNRSERDTLLAHELEVQRQIAAYRRGEPGGRGRTTSRRAPNLSKEELGVVARLTARQKQIERRMEEIRRAETAAAVKQTKAESRKPGQTFAQRVQELLAQKRSPEWEAQIHRFNSPAAKARAANRIPQGNTDAVRQEGRRGNATETGGTGRDERKAAGREQGRGGQEADRHGVGPVPRGEDRQAGADRSRQGATDQGKAGEGPRGEAGGPQGRQGPQADRSPADGKAGTLRGPGGGQDVQVADNGQGRAGLPVRGAGGKVEEREGHGGQRVAVSTDHSVPLAAGISKDGKTVYIDPSIPRTLAMDDGTNVDVHKYLVIHETAEKPGMDQQGKTYPDAHDENAVPAENAALRKDGIDPREFNAKLKPYIDAIAERERGKVDRGEAQNIPPDLHEKHVEASQKAGLLPRKPGGMAPGEREYKRPDLAMPHSDPVLRDAMKQAQNDYERDVQHFKEIHDKAAKDVKEDPDGVLHDLMELRRQGRPLTAGETSQAITLIARLKSQGRGEEMNSLARAFLGTGGDSAIALGIRHDAMKTPEGRFSEANGMMVVGPVKKATAISKLEARVAELEKQVEQGAPKPQGRFAAKRAQLKDEFHQLVKKVQAHAAGYGGLSSHGTGFAKAIGALLANRVAAGSLRFADAALEILHHVREWRKNADVHAEMKDAWNDMRKQDSRLDEAEDVGSLIRAGRQYKNPIGPKPLDEMVKDAEARVADLSKRMTAERDRLAAMSPAERLAERDAQRPPPEVDQARKEAMADLADLRKEVATLKDNNRAVQGQQLPPEMRALSRKLMVTKAALEKAKADDAKRLVEDKAALKKEGWDLDDPNAAWTKDPAEFEHMMAHLTARHAGLWGAFMMNWYRGFLHLSGYIPAKKVFSDGINVASALSSTVQLGLARDMWTSGGRGELNARAKATFPAMWKGIKEFGSTMLTGENQFDSKLSEYPRIDPLVAKTDKGSFMRGLVRTYHHVTLITLVKSIDAGMKTMIGHVEVAGQAYARAKGRDGKRLTGGALDLHMQEEMSNHKSESWAAAIDKAHQMTFTEPPSGLLARFIGWKGSPGGNTINRVVKAGANVLVPFTLIPFNRAKQAVLQHIPIVSDLATVARFAMVKDEKTGERYLGMKDLPREVTRAVTRIAVASGVYALVNQQADDGKPRMLGAGHGEDSYTIAYGPHRFKYLELGSLGPGLGLWADVMHGINKGHVPDEMWKGLQQMSKREHQDPLTAPAQELYRAFVTDHRKGAGIKESAFVGAGEMLGRTAASFAMPSLGRQAQHATRDNQPNYRETDTDFTSAFMHSFIAGALPSTLPDRKRDDQPMAKDRFENPVATVMYRLLMPFPMGSPQQPKQSTAAR